MASASDVKALMDSSYTRCNRVNLSFDFPMPFPWRLMHFWKDVDIWPISRVLSNEGQAEYKKTFDSLAGEPIKW